MSSHEYNLATLAIRSLRVKTLLDEVPKTQLAQTLGVNRATVAKFLKSDDMSLNMFLTIATDIGADPAEIINQAIQEQEGA